MFKLARRAITISAIAGVGGAGFYFLSGRDCRAGVHKHVITPVARYLLDGEDAHKFTIEFFKHPQLSPKAPENFDKSNDPTGSCEVTLFKNAANPKVKPLVLQNPVGMAAGFDKNADAIDTLFNLGFSYVEVGSVTPLPQPGNPQPRVFRLERDGAVINRYGFNSLGHLDVLGRLTMRESQLPAGSTNFAGLEKRALAVNLGKNKTGDEIEDYTKGVEAFGPHADVLVINVSSPNTPGLRDLQSEEKLTNLLKTVVAKRDSLPLDTLPPVVVKIAPDLTAPEITSIAAAVKESKVDGVIVSNTTIQRPDSLKAPAELKNQAGGLSGIPIKPFSINALRLLRKELGKDITIIGCGGISNGKDALDFAKAGADFVQLYTSLAYQGPGVACDIKEQIVRELKGKKWSDVVGTEL